MKKVVLILIISLFLLTGCNKQIIDYDGDKFELEIQEWTDYEGEQIQVKSKNKTYLISSNKCYLLKESDK